MHLAFCPRCASHDVKLVKKVPRASDFYYCRHCGHYFNA